jgi:hypothetical protein
MTAILISSSILLMNGFIHSQITIELIKNSPSLIIKSRWFASILLSFISLPLPFQFLLPLGSFISEASGID